MHEECDLDTFCALCVREMVETAVTAERERCAKIAEECERHSKYAPGRCDFGWRRAAREITKRIREAR